MIGVSELNESLISECFSYKGFWWGEIRYLIEKANAPPINTKIPANKRLFLLNIKITGFSLTVQ